MGRRRYEDRATHSAGEPASQRGPGVRGGRAAACLVEYRRDGADERPRGGSATHYWRMGEDGAKRAMWLAWKASVSHTGGTKPSTSHRRPTVPANPRR